MFVDRDVLVVFWDFTGLSCTMDFYRKKSVIISLLWCDKILIFLILFVCVFFVLKIFY